MTDAPLTMTVATSERAVAAEARIRKRYRAEARFRAYGMIALMSAAGFLLLLMADVISRAMPALTASSIKLEVPIAAEFVDPNGTKDPAVIARGDFPKVVREAMLALFPEAAKDRKARKLLNGALSTGASDDLLAHVIANPAAIGTTMPLDALLSDDADLYLKDLAMTSRRIDGAGNAQVSASSGPVTVQLDTAALPPLPAPAGANAPSVLLITAQGAIKASRISNGTLEGETVIPLRAVSAAAPWSAVVIETPETQRKLDDASVAAIEVLRASGLTTRHFNWTFFTNGDSREAEVAGILGSLVGSILTMLITLVLCLPIGVLAAVYLEAFAPKNRITEIIEVNINNLAAVPSIVFGLLGLAMFLNLFGLPRSSPLVGGLVLALLVLPTIIIASRAALRAVPPSIREAALGVGASHQQAVFDHVLPLAVPGIMTGTIIGMAHALGETAPLLLIGMVAFIVDIPHSVTQAATVLPVQIFLWSDLPERLYEAKTAAAILVLLVFLIFMNGLAVYMRRKFERRW